MYQTVIHWSNVKALRFVADFTWKEKGWVGGGLFLGLISWWIFFFFFFKLNWKNETTWHRPDRINIVLKLLVLPLMYNWSTHQYTQLPAKVHSWHTDHSLFSLSCQCDWHTHTLLQRRREWGKNVFLQPLKSRRGIICFPSICIHVSSTLLDLTLVISWQCQTTSN